MPSVTTSRHRSARLTRRPNLQLIALRVNAGLSREQLSLRINVGRETIRLAEAGFVPTPRVQFALASQFGRVPLDIWPIEAQPRPAKRRRTELADAA